MATTGDASDFGDLSVSTGYLAGSVASNATRGLFAGGNNPTIRDTIDFVTIASTAMPQILET